MIELRRSYLDNCTIGKLFFRGELVCYTIERPWLNNEKSFSCVPSGDYDLQPYSSARYTDSYSLTSASLGVGLTDKFQRSHILIHVGNFPDDIEGCIAPGTALHPSTWGVSNSRVAMRNLRGLIESENISKIQIR